MWLVGVCCTQLWDHTSHSNEETPRISKPWSKPSKTLSTTFPHQILIIKERMQKRSNQNEPIPDNRPQQQLGRYLIYNSSRVLALHAPQRSAWFIMLNVWSTVNLIYSYLNKITVCNINSRKCRWLKKSTPSKIRMVGISLFSVGIEIKRDFATEATTFSCIYSIINTNHSSAKWDYKPTLPGKPLVGGISGISGIQPKNWPNPKRELFLFNIGAEYCRLYTFSLSKTWNLIHNLKFPVNFTGTKNNRDFLFLIIPYLDKTDIKEQSHAETIMVGYLSIFDGLGGVRWTQGQT